jgi:hypothetical protein
MRYVTFAVSLLIGLFLTYQFLPSSSFSSTNLLKSEFDNSCGNPTFLVDVQSDAPAQVSVLEAGCDGEFRWKAQIELKNVGDKVIRGYEVADVSTYENMKDSWSSQGSNGREIKPGESLIVYCNAGYSKPVGKLQKVVFRVEKIEFNDGTIWKHHNSKRKVY